MGVGEGRFGERCEELLGEVWESVFGCGGGVGREVWGSVLGCGGR